MRDSNAEMLGEDVMRKTGPVFGLDEEGELNGSYRPCGHPGVRRTWFRLTLRRMAYARFVRCYSCGLRRGTSLWRASFRNIWYVLLRVLVNLAVLTVVLRCHAQAMQIKAIELGLNPQ